jgi:hypothetical protein
VLGLVIVLGIIGAVTKKTVKTSPQAAAPAPNAPGTPSGFKTYADSIDSFTIAVPQSWADVNPSGPGAAAAVAILQKQNPEFDKVFGSAQSMAAEGVKFISLDPDSTGGESANVNVVVKAADGFDSSDLSQLAQALPSEYQKVNATLISSQRVTYDSHDSLEVRLNLNLNNTAGTPITIPETQYFVPANDRLYVVTLSGSDSRLQTIAANFEIH